VLGGLAEFERDFDPRPHPARCVKMGRKPKLTHHQKHEAVRRRDELGEPLREIARSYNVSHSTISRLSA
jgi:DNA invertase Pin-like site-specific DNA recombinase